MTTAILPLSEKREGKSFNCVSAMMGDLFDWMAGKLWDAVRDLRIAGGW